MHSDDEFEPAELTLIGEESDCSYLPGRVSQFEYRWATTLSEERYERLLARGWRRFGRTLFRPVCRQCTECRSLRVSLSEFRPSKSQRRCFRHNTDVRVIVQAPTVTDDHLRMYNAYHRDMSERRGWPQRDISAQEYYQSFIDGHFEFAREFLYLRNDQLIGIGIVDQTCRVQSSVYFIHDPAWRPNGPGTFSVLSEIEAGRAEGRDYQYMGYYIRDCQSMNYKNRFEPHQLLQSHVADSQEPVWQFPDSDKSDKTV